MRLANSTCLGLFTVLPTPAAGGSVMERQCTLGLAWWYDIKSRTARGLEAIPIVIGGVIYASGAWSHVIALEARTGKLLWEFDPQVPGTYAGKGCCDVVNRGVAVWGGKVFIGAYDGRLIALDARCGRKVWETLTVDQARDYTITGAPRVVKGKVIIGNGGAEFGVRGYVSAYDADTGTLVWRFYTVPGHPKDGFETKTVEMIAKTWGGEWWRYGGGGTVWDSMAYDPELDLLYIGVGGGRRGSPRRQGPGPGPKASRWRDGPRDPLVRAGGGHRALALRSCPAVPLGLRDQPLSLFHDAPSRPGTGGAPPEPIPRRRGARRRLRRPGTPLADVQGRLRRHPAALSRAGGDPSAVAELTRAGAWGGAGGAAFAASGSSQGGWCWAADAPRAGRGRRPAAVSPSPRPW
jgi:PQQ-like domain